MVIRNKNGERPESAASCRTKETIDRQHLLNYLAEKLWEERQRQTDSSPQIRYLDPEAKAGEISEIFTELECSSKLVEILSKRYPEALREFKQKSHARGPITR